MANRIILNAAELKGWRKSSHSNDQGGSCLEILDACAIGVPVRDSKNPQGPAVIVPASAWSSFVTALKDGTFRS